MNSRNTGRLLSLVLGLVLIFSAFVRVEAQSTDAEWIEHVNYCNHLKLITLSAIGGAQDDKPLETILGELYGWRETPKGQKLKQYEFLVLERIIRTVYRHKTKSNEFILKKSLLECK